MKEQFQNLASENGKPAKWQKTKVDICNGLAKFHIRDGQWSFNQRQTVAFVRDGATKMHDFEKICKLKMKVTITKLANFEK